MTGGLVCPGCGKAKTARAELCRPCRRKANRIGADALLGLRGLREHLDETGLNRAAEKIGARPPQRPAEKLTPGQKRAVHGIAASIDRARGAPARTTHDELLHLLSDRWGRELESVNEILETEADEVIDGILRPWLRNEQDALAARLPPATATE